MFILPDNPNLDFLRQQAKDLLAALRESNPSTSLTDAQRALAGEYGFDNWTALRAEVEQRRQQPPSVPDGLAEGLAAAFDLGRVTGMQPVSYNPMGRVWSLTTAHGRWLAVPGYHWMGEEQAEIGATLQAAAAGVQSLTPRRSGAGHLVETVAGTPWRITEWMEMGPCPICPVRAAVARRVGEIAGTLHALALPSNAAIGHHLTFRHSESDWGKLLQRARAAGRPWADRLAELLPAYVDLGTIGATIPTDNLILCNRNLIPENVRLGSGNELIVTEWTFTGSLTAELEIASLLTHWVMRPDVNRVGAKAFADGYADRAGAFPRLTLDSFGVAISGYLNWTYNTFCEGINGADPDGAAFVEGETVDLLKNPLTPATLQQLIDATGG